MHIRAPALTCVNKARSYPCSAGVVKCTLFLALALVCIGIVSCKQPKSGATGRAEPPLPQSFSVRGVLRQIDFAGRAVTVEHEEIPNFMPAMTMPFDVKVMTEVEPLRVGDAIAFTMIVTNKSSWIEGVKKIAASEVNLPARTRSVAGAGANVERLKEGDRLPDFQLIDSQGRAITRETFAGRPLILTFIFTRCPIPNFCPLMTNHFREIQQALADAPGAAKAQLLSISFDSEFDAPKVLAQYAARHTKDTDQWRFAIGTAAETKRLTQAFSVAVQPEGGAIAHGLATALVGADGIIRNIWRGNGWTPAEVIEATSALSVKR